MPKEHLTWGSVKLLVTGKYRNKKRITTTPYRATCSPCHCLLNLKENQWSVQNLYPGGRFLDR